MRMLVVYGPLAETGEAERYLREICPVLREAGFELAFLAAPGQRAGWTREPVHTLPSSNG